MIEKQENVYKTWTIQNVIIIPHSNHQTWRKYEIMLPSYRFPNFESAVVSDNFIGKVLDHFLWKSCFSLPSLPLILQRNLAPKIIHINYIYNFFKRLKNDCYFSCVSHGHKSLYTLRHTHDVALCAHTCTQSHILFYAWAFVLKGRPGMSCGLCGQRTKAWPLCSNPSRQGGMSFLCPQSNHFTSVSCCEHKRVNCLSF